MYKIYRLSECKSLLILDRVLQFSFVFMWIVENFKYQIFLIWDLDYFK